MGDERDIGTDGWERLNEQELWRSLSVSRTRSHLGSLLRTTLENAQFNSIYDRPPSSEFGQTILQSFLVTTFK